MDLIKEFPLLNQPLFDSIKSFIDADVQPFSSSRVYDVEKAELLIDEELRQSKYKTIANPDLFALVDAYLQEFTKLDKYADYVLVKNNITIIQYQEGDFFKNHSDFLSWKCNAFQEFTWILCLSADCNGGETVMHINDFFKHPSTASKTTGHSILFRKDMNHEGAIITSGHKHIMTCNIHVFPSLKQGGSSLPKDCNEILIVDFGEQHPEKYVLPVINVLKHESILKVAIDFAKNTKYKYVTYDNITPEQFAIIYKIIMDEYVTFDEFHASKDILDYFCIDVKNILFNLQSGGEIKTVNNLSFNQPIILFHDGETAEYAKNIVSENGLPYVPFKVVFAEGMNDDVSYATFPYLSCGDNCVMYYFKVDSGSDITGRIDVGEILKFNRNDEVAKMNWKQRKNWSAKDYTHYNIHSCCIFSEQIEDEVESEEDGESGNDDSESDESEDDIPVRRPTKTVAVAKSPRSAIADDELVKFYRNDNEKPPLENGATYSQYPFNADSLYGSMQYIDFDFSIPNISNKDVIELLVQKDEYHDFTHHTFKKTNKTDFELMQCVKAKMIELHFFDYIRANINSLQFHLPQYKENHHKHFCNEEVYVKSTLIVIDGLICCE
jgi:hypothetical protein